MYPLITAPGSSQVYSSVSETPPYPSKYSQGTFEQHSSFSYQQQTTAGQQNYSVLLQHQWQQHPSMTTQQQTYQTNGSAAPHHQHSISSHIYPPMQHQHQQQQYQPTPLHQQQPGGIAYPSAASPHQQTQAAPYPYPSQGGVPAPQQQQQQYSQYTPQQQSPAYPDVQRPTYPSDQQQQTYHPQWQQNPQHQHQHQQQQQQQLPYPSLQQHAPQSQLQLQPLHQLSLNPHQQQQQQSLYPPLERQQSPAQQQQQQPLPKYPTLPPSLTFKAPPESVANGYDVLVYINQAVKLPGMDWWNGKADPYVIITTVADGSEQELVYKTKTVQKSLNPVFDEFFELCNLPAGSTLVIEVWDQDVVTDDDIIGRACWQFAPKEMLPNASAGGGMLGGDVSWGRLPIMLKLCHPIKKKLPKGTIEMEVCYRPSQKSGKPAMMGPVKFRQHLSPTAGALLGHWGNADTMSFSTYKLYLMHIESTFKGVRCPWNKKYDKAKTIFTNPMVMGMVCTQHNSLYATRMGASRCGVLSTSQDFFDLFKGGQRAGQRRYFTYTLLEDSFRCSETGATFFSDMMSKHAMHACGAEEVLFAGEFCIVPDSSAAGNHRLVIDNNSGTYAPDTKHLPLMERLFKANFKDMAVEVLAVGDPRLEFYQKQCPSRACIN